MQDLKKSIGNEYFPLTNMYSLIFFFFFFLLEESESYVYIKHDILKHLKVQINVLTCNILHRNRTI